MKKHIAEVAWSDVTAEEIIAATEDKTPAIAWPYHGSNSSKNYWHCRFLQSANWEKIVSWYNSFNIFRWHISSMIKWGCLHHRRKYRDYTRSEKIHCKKSGCLLLRWARLYRCCWRKLEIKYVGDKLGVLVDE